VLALREYAARLDATVTPELVEKAFEVRNKYLLQHQTIEYSPADLMRAALLAAVPLGEDAKPKYPSNLLVDCRRLIEGRAARGNEHARATLKAIDAELAREGTR
jgi:hypothetical protein